MIRTVIVVSSLLLGACSSPPTEPVSVPAIDKGSNVPTGQLPTSIQPLAYELDLTIVPEREDFNGHVVIDIEIRESLDRFYLHANGLHVSESRLTLASGKTLPVTFRQSDVEGVAEIVLPRPVSEQTARLQMSYAGAFSKNLAGLYRVVDGAESYAYTQFEAINARDAFPCFDEPRFKTPFSINLSVASGQVAITTTPEVERIPRENGLQRIRFARTPPLPTYLIAFAVGPLDVVVAPDIPATPQRKVPLPLRGVATAGKGDRLGHALGTTPELLVLLEDYFNLAHPYPKLDILAVPEFASGAMENVGAITYRESLLLLADDAPVLQRRRHALVHAHEMAHMWFGNLVTMPWWDDIWLNEAFATWMAYKTVAAWNPEHSAGLSRLTRLHAAMDEDTLSTARQIRQPIESNHDIENAFDGITYSKGGAVLTMFERFMGADRFREAIRYHVSRFQHGSADANDFIESLAHIGGQEITDAFRSFLFQPGIPILDVALDCSADRPTVMINQSRFRTTGTVARSAQRWKIPVCLRYGSDGQQQESCHMVADETNIVALKTTQCPTWLLPNAGYAGYFHWVLPDSSYAGLIQAESHLSAVEQRSIEASINAALASNRMTVGEGATLLATLAKSERPSVAMAPKRFIEYSRDYLVSPGQSTLGLAQYVQKLYGDVPAANAFDPDYMRAVPRDARRLYLVDAAELLAWAGDEAVRTAARTRAMDWISGHDERLAPSSVELALRIALEDSGGEVFLPLMERFKNSRDGQERRTILRAIARVSEPELAAQIRDIALGNDIRINEIRGFLGEHVKNSGNRMATWQWLQQHFGELVERLPPGDAGRLPAILAAGLCDEALASDVQTFLGPRMENLLGGPRNLAKTVETIRLCARRVATQRPQAAEFF